MASPRILVVVDEPTVVHVVGNVLEQAGCVVGVAHSAEQALALIQECPPAVAFLDIVLPGMSGLELLRKIKATSSETVVVMMTSHASIETAVEALKAGAYDYLDKPFEDINIVSITVKRALERHELSVRNLALTEERKKKTEELAATVTRLSSLIEAGRAMGDFNSLDDLLDFFVGLVARELDVERVSLMLVDAKTETLRIAASRGITNVNVDDVCIGIGEGIAGSVVCDGEPLLVQDIRADPRVEGHDNLSWGDSFISAPIALSVPIKSRKDVFGVINLTDRRSRQPFTDADLDYVAGLAGQLSVAIERSRHFHNLQNAYNTLKDTQHQLVATERLKAIGQMAAGVAHDFNNALNVILARTELSLATLAGGSYDPQKLIVDLEHVRKATLQAEGTVKRIQNYTRIRHDVPHAIVDLNEVVRDAVEMTRPKWKGESEAGDRQIEVIVELGEIKPVSGNHHELTQVIDNLIFNSVEAMPAGGTVRIRTALAGDRVTLEVTDTGVGMEEATRKRLFEPFFTTKATGQGLGTSIVFGIVSRHSGDIAVESEKDQGTTVRIELPSTEPPKTEASPPQVRPERETKRLRILLVDDDDQVLHVNEDALCHGGHEVVAVSGGEEALAQLERRRFDLVLTDLSMPGMSGLELTRRIRRRGVTPRIILLSGWSVQEHEEKMYAAGVDRVLAKPCSILTLLEIVQEVAADE